MAAAPLSILFLSFLFLSVLPLHSFTSSLYFSPTTLFDNYQKMLGDFKIYIYDPPKSFNFSTPPSSLFHSSLLGSHFVTRDPEEAHLFFIPCSPELSTRSLARVIRELRTIYPYWNRTLGADHFFISSAGIDFSADRNILELKKNAVQISNFPTISGLFIPHKDITFPPLNPSPLALSRALERGTTHSLGYLKWDGKTEGDLVNELRYDSDFVVEALPLGYAGGVKNSKFCLFFYNADMAWMGEAMAMGCVPVVIVDRPIQDMPLMDVLRWSEMAVLVSKSGGVRKLKKVLRTVPKERYEKMREFSVTASQHFVWNAKSQPYDAFHMVMYQLWLRRHTIRYARKNWI